MFRGFDPERDRLVAIKLFRLDLPPERVHRLVAALQRLTSGALKHPAIAAPIAAGIQENTAYLVQEYVAADSLDVVLRDQGPAPLSDALRVARQLADAVDAGVAHGAIHPRDVLLSAHDARVTGFGIVPALEQVGVAAPLRRPYTAPERLAGAAWDRRADIFSIAAVMYEVLTGKRITGTGEAGVPGLAEVEGADVPALIATFGRALAENPADRYDTGSGFAEDLAKSSVVSRRSPAGRPSAAAKKKEPALPLEEPELPLNPRAEAPPEPVVPALEAPLAAKPVPPTPMLLAPAPPAKKVIARPPPPVPAAPVVVPPAPLPPIETPKPAARPASEPPPRPAPRPEPRRPPPPDDPLPGERHEAQPTLFMSALNRSRSAMWPLALAFVVGLGLGIAFGFGLYPVMNRESAVDTVAAEPAGPPVPAATTPRHATPAATATPEPAAAAAPAPAPPPAPAAPAPPPAAARAEAPRPVRRPAPPPENPGRLLVRTSPAGARVFVDGRDRGASPAEVRDLTAGVHTIRVARDGYAPEERQVAVTVERPALNLTIAMARLSVPAPARVATEAVRIESRPAGASVFLDGRLIGTTPLVVSDVAVGAHQVRLQLDGYRLWQVSTDVNPGGDNHITGSLER